MSSDSPTAFNPTYIIKDTTAKNINEYVKGFPPTIAATPKTPVNNKKSGSFISVEFRTISPYPPENKLMIILQKSHEV